MSNRSERVKWKEFKELKIEITIKIGGRKKFLTLFPESSERKNLYEAVLFERSIFGGRENKNIYKKYLSLIS